MFPTYCVIFLGNFFFFFLNFNSCNEVDVFLSSTMKLNIYCRVYEIERHVKTPEKYLFPSFETICWYAAKYVLDILKGKLGHIFFYYMPFYSDHYAQLGCYTMFQLL